MPSCPSCSVEMNSKGLDGNYKKYECPEGCSITLLRPATANPNEDGFSLEDLSNMAEF